MRLDYLLEALNRVPLIEGAQVDGEVNRILKTGGIGSANKAEDDSNFKPVRQKVIDTLNGLDTVKQSKNGRDAMPMAQWLLDVWDRDLANLATALEQINDLVTIKNQILPPEKDLAQIQKKNPTVDDFRKFIRRERDIAQTKVADNDKGVEGFNFPNPYYSDDDVDVYKAESVQDAIKYSKGYNFCIGRTDGSNLFYNYRVSDEAPDSTAYFCWFKDENGVKHHDDMCVIHVSSNGMYRMTNSENDNGSPVVEKAKLLRYYPKLRNALGKLKSDPLDTEESAVSGVSPFSTIELDHVSRMYTRKQIAILIGKACVFSDEFFDYVYNDFDGKDLERGDSLIRKYLVVGAQCPTAEQQQQLINDGYRSYVEYNLKQYTKQSAEIDMQNVESTVQYDRKGMPFYYAKDAEVVLRAPLKYPIMSRSGMLGIELVGGLWNNENIGYINSMTSQNLNITRCTHVTSLSNINVKGVKFLYITNSPIQSVDLGRKYDFSIVHITNCKYLTSLASNTAKQLRVDKCPNFVPNRNDTKVRELMLYNMSFSDCSNTPKKLDSIYISNNPALKSLDGLSIIPNKVGSSSYKGVVLDNCPNLSDISVLGSLAKKFSKSKADEYLSIRRCPKVTEESYKKYAIPFATVGNVKLSDKERNEKFIKDNSTSGARGKSYIITRNTKAGKIYTYSPEHPSDMRYFGPVKYPISTDLSIFSDSNVADYSGVAKAQELSIMKNNELVNLDTLANTKVRTLKVTDCPFLMSTRGCPKTAQYICFESCPVLKDLSGLPSKINGELALLFIPNIPPLTCKYINKLMVEYNTYTRDNADLSFISPHTKIDTLSVYGGVFGDEPFKGLPKCNEVWLSSVLYLKNFQGITQGNAPDNLYIEFGSNQSQQASLIPIDEYKRVMSYGCRIEVDDESVARVLSKLMK